VSPIEGAVVTAVPVAVPVFPAGATTVPASLALPPGAGPLSLFTPGTAGEPASLVTAVPVPAPRPTVPEPDESVPRDPVVTAL